MNRLLKKFLIPFLILVLFVNIVLSQENNQRKDLEKKIEEYQKKLTELRQQRNTLASQIEYMDTQIYLTNLKIQQTEEKIEKTTKEIDTLETKIGDLDKSLDHLSKLLLNKVVQSYKQRELSFLNIFFDSLNAKVLINKIKYLKTVRDNNQRLLIQVQQTKLNFEEQKKLREEKMIELDNLKSTLAQQKIDLNTQKAAKQKLLIETNNDEATYQKLLSQAKAQLASFRRFVQNQGGASLLNNQTVCDDWGCYYSQRDSQWGSNSLNGTSYTLASDGCLVTSMAMVYTHLGKRNVTPQTINSNPNNFASYYPAYLLYTISADGLTTSRIKADIDSTLASGDPVVVGINAYGGTHFVVLISGSNGNYIMNDPYIENGHKISFNKYYSVENIFEIRKVVIVQ